MFKKLFQMRSYVDYKSIYKKDPIIYTNWCIDYYNKNGLRDSVESRRGFNNYLNRRLEDYPESFVEVVKSYTL